MSISGLKSNDMTVARAGIEHKSAIEE